MAIQSVAALPNIWGQALTAFPQGATLDIVITGDGFSDTSTVSFSPAGVSVVRLGLLLNPEALQVTIAVGDNAPVGSYELTVLTAGLSQSFANAFNVISIGKQYRIPLELNGSPLIVPINPSDPVYDSSGAYIYRIQALPILMTLTFKCDGPSFVEVYDADNQRFLLGQKVSINTDTTFPIQWDGSGVFEPRVWKNGQVTGISASYQVPGDQTIPPVGPGTNWSPWVLSGSLAGGVIMALIGATRRK